MISRALISVYDKTGIVDFARALHSEFGIEIISTGGTAKTLSEAGIPVTLIESITGFPEMLDGRVKTLHPAIHAGILADRDNPEHMRQLQAAGIKPIDMVVVKLYPFEQTVADPNCTFEQAIEMIDIGGVALLRAAAKNHKHVITLSESDDYDIWLRLWRADGGINVGGQRGQVACGRAAFRATAQYDAQISHWLSIAMDSWPQDAALFAQNWGPMRYGENSHQQSQLYSVTASDTPNLVFSGLGERDEQARLSYNNYLDADAALGLCAELARNAGQIGIWGHRLSVGDSPATVVGHQGIVGHRLSAGGSIFDEQIHFRNLPHIQRPDATYLLTFRIRQGHLTPSERDILAVSILYGAGLQYALHAAIIMPDHVHLLLTPLENSPREWTALGTIIKGIKGSTARKINQQRGAAGSLWLDEYWDTIVRDESHLRSAISYIYENAARAGLEYGKPYPWCVVDPEISWNQDSRAAGISLEPSLIVGRADKGAEVEGRGWHGRVNAHRLRVGAPGQEGEHRLRVGAPQRMEAPQATGAPQATDASQRSGAQGRLDTCVCCFIKHTNACGVGVAADAIEAYRQAYLGDPNAAMGGILACNFEIDAAFAATVMETYDRFGKPLKEAGAAYAPGGFFVEVWIAPHFSDDAVKIIRGTSESAPKKKWGENVRLLALGDMTTPANPTALQYRSIAGGMLVQTPDLLGLNEELWKVVTQRQPTESEMADLRLAWLIAKHTKSNAISICKDGMLIGNGAGQMSRVMSCRIATWLARENGHAEQLPGSSAASDAFFPFADGPRILLDAGVTALIQPGGSKRDEQTIQLCDERGVAMIFTGTRHFRH